MDLIFGQDAAMAKWAAGRIPHVGEAGFGPCRAIGVGDVGKRRLYAACVYHNLIQQYAVCEISFAASTPRWATKGNIRALLSVPFNQYGMRKVYLTIPIDNKRALRFCEGIHFRKEATLRHHFAPGRHALVLSMMASEYRQHWATPKLKMKAAA